MIAIGLGCRRGTAGEEVVALVREAVALMERSPLRSGTAGHATEGNRGLFTVAEKRGEAGLEAAARTLDLPLTFLDRAVLALVAGEARSCSRRVEEMFGLPGIAETAALAGAGGGAVLLVPRMASAAATCAIAGPAPIEGRTPAANLVVERARARDVASIRAIVAAACASCVERLGGRPAPMAVDWAALVGTGTVHVLRVEGTVVGTVTLSEEGDALALGNLAVEPSLRGRGHGGALMAHAEAIATARGLAAVTLITNEAMHEAIAFCATLGFAETGRGTVNGLARIRFRKELA